VLAYRVSRSNEMEERYENTTIMITVGLGERRMRWKPICRGKVYERPARSDQRS
jgi:hypothetical protein